MSNRTQLIGFVVLLCELLAIAQTGFAQAPDSPLNLGNNFFVTGDYVVAGAAGMTTNFSGSYAVGTITIPDPNPGITGVKQVPAGAQIVDAVLYWETAEKVGVTPGGSGSGQNGYFRPLGIAGGPAAPGYPISGVNLSNGSTVGWSSGGCVGTSTGKVLQTYRADVVGYLPQDVNGNVLVNGQFEVRLPSVGPSTPLTLGATLVVIYRVITTVSGSVAPLNAVVIYEGAYAPTSTTLTMTQTIKDFYQAGNDQPGKAVVSRLTHIVGNGKSNKYQTVYLNGQALPSLYGKAQPAFPGYYGTWDNPTWTFPSPNSPNPIQAGASSVTTEVAPPMSNQGCVSWGAIIVGTTVQDSDQDGILDIWKTDQGYTDVGTGLPVSLADIPLSPADPPDPPQKGHKDVFIQLDYVTEPLGVSFEPTPQVLQNVHDAFLAHNIHLHFTGFNAIPEGECTDSGGQPTCPYPNQPGITTWRGGLEFVRNYLIPLPAFPGVDCTQVPQDCGPRFPQAQKDSYHYVVFGDSVGDASWSLSDGSLAKVVAKGNTVTFTTAAAFPTGMPQNLDDTTCTNGRVSIADAITNPRLNGTYCVQTYGPNSFTITIPAAANATYTHATDPNLAVATGQAISRSGTSDLGGAVSLITLGLWGADGQSTTVQEGTLMHELGHTFYLPHGGVFYSPKAPYVPIFEANCKPNYQSVMSYMFQVDLLDKYDPNNNSFTGGYLDFSEDTLIPLNIVSLGGVKQLTKTDGTAPTYGGIKWYAPGTPVGTPATRYCDGTPLPNNPPKMVLLEGTASAISPAWTANQNIDFDPPGSPLVLDGFNDWASLDLRQVGATGSSYELGGAFPKGGGAFPKGGGAFPSGGGAFPSGGGAYPRGGGAYPRGGGLSGGDINHQAANSVTRSARNLTATEAVSARTITLNWATPTFGQIGAYNVYRSEAGGAFTLLNPPNTVVGNPPLTTFTDTVSCDPGGYQYFVTAVLVDTTQESAPSNTVSLSNGKPLTGCYTNTAPGSVALTNLAFTDLSSPNTPVQGDNIQITWSLNDDDTGVSVTRAAASTALVAIGPIPSDATCSSLPKPPEYLGFSGMYPYPVTTLSTSGSGITGNPFAFTWNTANAIAGCYFYELDLDSKQYEQSTALELLIYVSDSSPHVTTTALPNGVVGNPYSNTLFEAGGVSPFTWTYTGSLPSGITLGASTGTVSGTACFVGGYSFTAKVTDSNKNYGTQALMLQIQQAGTSTSATSNASTSVFQQMVTFTVTVTPQYGCTPTGTVTLMDGASTIASLPLPSGGTATFTTSALSVGVHSITASYSGDANFTSSMAVYSQTVNPANTQIAFSPLSLPTAFVGQPITISYTFSVVAPGAGSPIPPSGNIIVSASDHSSCMAAAVQGAGMCTLSPAPTTAGGPVTFTITYPGDSNFVASAANGNYTVYQLVITAQPSNTGVGLTITPAVVVTAEDSGGNPFTGFTGGITMAIGSGPGTLSGTTTQYAVAGVATFNDLSINKIANGYTLTASPSGGVPDATSSAFNIDTFYVDNQGNFGTLDLATGVVTPIGAGGTAPGSSGMDLTHGLQVYEYTSNQLMQITPSTGVEAPVGSAGTIPDQATTGALTDGSYFGIDLAGNLYSINLSTGATTLVGPTSAAVLPAGCSFEASLTGSATVLYYTIGFSGPNCSSPMNDTLYQINPTSGAITATIGLTVNGSGVNEFVGSTFVGGTLYGFTSGGQEYTINPATGVATFVTNTTVPIVGAGSSE